MKYKKTEIRCPSLSKERETKRTPGVLLVLVPIQACALNVPQRHPFGGASVAAPQRCGSQNQENNWRSLGFGTDSAVCAERELTSTKLNSAELIWNN